LLLGPTPFFLVRSTAKEARVFQLVVFHQQLCEFSNPSTNADKNNVDVQRVLEEWRCMPVECSYACANLAAWMHVIGYG
jgi:hypothetical protein